MSEYGLSAKGFKRKRLPDIYQSLCKRLSKKLGIPIETGSNSVFGQIFGVISYEISDLWEETENVYNAMYPHTSKGVSLNNSAALAGITPISAEKTTLLATCIGRDGTAVPYGAQITSGSDNTLTFSCIDENAYISNQTANVAKITVPSVSIGTQYAVTIDGGRIGYTAVSGDEASNILQGIAAGLDTTKITGVISDGTLTITMLDESKTFSISVSNLTIVQTGTPVTFACDYTGDINPITGEVNQILTPYSGWEEVSNNVPANVGRNAETDTEMRQRWNKSLYTRASAMTDAIAASLLSVEGVTTAIVYENPDDDTDDDGRPPHSIEAVVSGGLPADIGLAIWKGKCGGIDTYGSQSVEIRDSQGIARTINFNRPIGVKIWLKISIDKYIEEVFPANAVTLIQQAVYEAGCKLAVGVDVILQRFIATIFNSVSGVGMVTITACSGDEEDTYTDDNIEIDARHVAEFDVNRIEVTVT